MLKLGACIIEARQKQSLTQDELGEKLGVSAQAVSKWERGLSLPDTGILPDIARVLKISVDMLLELETPEAAAARNRESVKAQEWVTGNYEPFMSGNGTFTEIVVSFSIDLFRFDGMRTAFDRMLEGIPILRKRIFRDRGVVLPVMRLKDDIDLGDDAVICFRGKTIWRDTFDSTRDYTDDRVFWDTQVGRGLYLLPAETPSTDWSNYTPPAEQPDAVEKPVVFFAYHVIRALYEAVVAKLPLFNTLDHTARIVAATRVHYPVLAEAVTGLFTLSDLRGVFTALLEAGCSIRELLTILEVLMEFKTAHPDGSIADAASVVKERLG